MTTLFAVTSSNGWFSTLAHDPFNILDELLMLRLRFVLRPPSHNTRDEQAQKNVHICAEFCKYIVDTLYHTHSRGNQSKNLVCFRSFDDAATPNTLFAKDGRPSFQTLQRFTCGVHVPHKVSPTKVVDGELIKCHQTRTAWILLELSSSFYPREECTSHTYGFRPRSVALMLSREEASRLQNAFVSPNVDIRCNLITQEAKSWLPPTRQPQVKAIGELGDVRSFYKHVNRYYSRAKDCATAHKQNNHFSFEDTVAKKRLAPPTTATITLCLPPLCTNSTTPYHSMRFCYFVMSESCHAKS